MELFSEKFKQAVNLALEGKKPIVAVLHKKGNRYTKEIAKRLGADIFRSNS